MAGLTFPQHTARAREHPGYWSYLASLEFVDRLVAEMDTQGMSGAELARRMGTSRAWVSRVLAGECNLTIATMGKLAFALGMKATVGLSPLGTDSTADRGAAVATALATASSTA